MRVQVTSLVAAAGLLLSGCTGSTPDPEDSGSGEPTASAAASASSSPSPSVPAKPKRPEAMKRDDAKGAAAAAEYFIELYPYVMATGDTEEFEAMSHRACGFCADALDDTARFRSKGQVYTGGESDGTIDVAYARDELTGIYPFDVMVRQKASAVLTRGGDEVSAAPSAAANVRVEVGTRDGAWVVVEVASAPKG